MTESIGNLLNAIANKGDADGGIADRLMGILEANFCA